MAFLTQLLSAYREPSRLSRRVFCRAAPLALALGVAFATGIIWVLYGTPFLSSIPAVLRGDLLPYFLFGCVTLAPLVPLIVKRLRDRGRSPLVLVLMGGIAFGFMLFSAPMPARLPVATLEDFVAHHVMFAPFVLVGLWALYECCFCGSASSAMPAQEEEPAPNAANCNEPDPAPAN